MQVLQILAMLGVSTTWACFKKSYNSIKCLKHNWCTFILEITRETGFECV